MHERDVAAVESSPVPPRSASAGADHGPQQIYRKLLCLSDLERADGEGPSLARSPKGLDRHDGVSPWGRVGAQRDLRGVEEGDAVDERHGVVANAVVVVVVVVARRRRRIIPLVLVSERDGGVGRDADAKELDIGLERGHCGQRADDSFWRGRCQKERRRNELWKRILAGQQKKHFFFRPPIRLLSLSLCLVEK